MHIDKIYFIKKGYTLQKDPCKLQMVITLGEWNEMKAVKYKINVIPKGKSKKSVTIYYKTKRG